jgi:hypothetical protein
MDHQQLVGEGRKQASAVDQTAIMEMNPLSFSDFMKNDPTSDSSSQLPLL